MLLFFFSSPRIEFSRSMLFSSWSIQQRLILILLLPRNSHVTRISTQPFPCVLIKRKFFVAVLSELEGLARGADARDCPPASRAALNPEHVARVAESAKAALIFARSRNPAIRCLTTRGTVLSSSSFTVEEDVDKVSKKLDKPRRFVTLTFAS